MGMVLTVVESQRWGSGQGILSRWCNLKTHPHLHPCIHQLLEPETYPPLLSPLLFVNSSSLSPTTPNSEFHLTLHPRYFLRHYLFSLIIYQLISGRSKI